MSEKFANQRAATKLNGAILAADTTLVVDDASGLPDDGIFRIILGQGAQAEIVQVGDISGPTLTTLTRGSEGTTPRDWPNNTAVSHILTAGGFDAGVSDKVTEHVALTNPHDQYATDTDLSGHSADTTAIHGITDTTALETATGAQTKVDTHSADTTAVHGITDTSALETASGATAKVAAHEADTTAVHGITDTSALETTTGSAAKVATHEADTTAVHGITNTASLETTTGSQTKVDTHVNDTSAAHAASAVAFTPTGTVASTDVQAAIAEVASESGAAAHPNLAVHDALGLSTDAELATHAGLAGVHNSFLDVTLAPYSADKTGVTEATSAIAAAIAAASSGGEVYLPAGTYLIDKITLDKRLRFRGDGKNATILKAKTGATGPLFNWNNSTLRAGCSMRGITFDMTLAPTIDAFYLHNGRNGVVDDLYFGPIAGAVAFHVDLVQGMTFSNIDVFNATTAAFKGTHGSSSGNRFVGCFTDNTTVTGVYGFLFDGGLDWWCIGCTSFRAPGTLIHLQYGYAWDYTTPNYNCTGKILGSTADAIMDLTEDSVVSAAMLFRGVGNCDIVDNFVGAYSAADAVSVPSIVLDDTKNMRFTSNRVGGHGIVFRGGASDAASFVGNNFLFGTIGGLGMYVLETQPTNVYEEGSWVDHYSVDSPPLASDATKWRIATGGDQRKAIRVGVSTPVDSDFNTPPPEGTFAYNDTLSRLHVRNSGGIYPYAQLTAAQTFYLAATNDDLSVQTTTTDARLREAASGVTFTQKSVVTDTGDATSYVTSTFGPTSGRDYLIFVLNLRSSSPTAINSITHTSIGSLSELGTVLSTDGKARLSVWKGRSTAATTGTLTVDFGGVTQSACAIRPYEVANDSNSVTTFATTGGTKTANATISPLTLTFGIEPVDHAVIAMGAKVTTTTATVGTGYTEKTVFSLADPGTETWAGEVKTKDAPDSSFTFTFSGTGEVMAIGVKVLLPTSTPTLSGFTGGVDGRVLAAENISAQNSITLKHNSGSTAINRLTLPSSTDYTLLPNSSLSFTYDGATTRWISGTPAQTPMPVKAGAISDADFVTPTSGNFGLDTTNHRFYIRDGSTWRYVEVN